MWLFVILSAFRVLGKNFSVIVLTSCGRDSVLLPSPCSDDYQEVCDTEAYLNFSLMNKTQHYYYYYFEAIVKPYGISNIGITLSLNCCMYTGFEQVYWSNFSCYM